MNVLVVYASIEGQTRKIAEFAARTIRAEGHEVTLFDATDTVASVSLAGVDRIVLAAPVHERRHPDTFEVFLAARRADLQARPSLFLSVSLNAAFEDGLEEAGDYVSELKLRTGFTPDEELLVAGAVRSESYDYYASQVIQHSVLRGRGDATPSEDREFTDWDGLNAALLGFLTDKPLSPEEGRPSLRRIP